MMTMSTLRERASVESLESNNSVNEHLVRTLLTGPMVWKGDDLDPNEYVVQLEPWEVETIKAAVITFKLLDLPRGMINKDTFPLRAGLAGKLGDLSGDIHHGCGVVVVRGLDVARFNDEEAVIAFAGLACYVCSERATDGYANQTLSHVRDATHDVVPSWAKGLGLAGSKLPLALDFHSDRFSGDVLALHVRNDGGADGGDQRLASFWSIYNELLRTAPQVLETLATPNWPFELKKPNGTPYLEMGPAMFIADGKPILQLVKAPLMGSSKILRHRSMPSISMEQQEALHVVEDLARRFSTKLDRRVGDIQFVHNLSIMHARSAYGTANGPSTRHLLRMFLRDPKYAWIKPETYRSQFDNAFKKGRVQELPIVDTDPWRKISGMESHG